MPFPLDHPSTLWSLSLTTGKLASCEVIFVPKGVQVRMLGMEEFSMSSPEVTKQCVIEGDTMTQRSVDNSQRKLVRVK